MSSTAISAFDMGCGQRGCQTDVTAVEHSLSCKSGGYVGQRHDNARDELAHLCELALSESKVSSEHDCL